VHRVNLPVSLFAYPFCQILMVPRQMRILMHGQTGRFVDYRQAVIYIYEL
jgi:hypothetical protein